MPAVTVHPSSIVENGAVLGEGVTVGPFCHIGAEARIGAGSVLRSHVVIGGRTTIGARADIYPFASIGLNPQHLKASGEATRLVIGDNCLIRESVTINRGTVQGRGETTVGDNCSFFTAAHVAHDCVLGHHVTLINNVMLGGHCVIGEHATVAGGSGIHQFTRVGHHAYVAGITGVRGDVIPFGMVTGSWGYLSGLNLIGMKRAGFDRRSIHNVRKAYRMLFSEETTFREALDEVEAEYAEDSLVQDLVGFIRAGGDRTMTFPQPSRLA